MDVSEAIIIDTAVNAAGFIVAGALSVLVYSLFGSLSHSTRPHATETQTSGSISDLDHDGRLESMEYVALSTDESSKEAGNDSSSLNSDRRRNRADIIRLARKMIQAGQTQAQVKDLLPVSDGELGLITRNLK